MESRITAAYRPSAAASHPESCAPDAPTASKAAPSGAGRAERLLRVKGVPPKVTRVGDNQYRGTAGLREHQIADVVGLNAVRVVEGDLGDAARGRGQHDVGRLVAANGRRRLSGRRIVNGEMQPDVTRLLPAVPDRRDNPVAGEPQGGDREIRGRRADVRDLDLNRRGQADAIARVPAAGLQVGDHDHGAGASADGVGGGRERGAVARAPEADPRRVDCGRGQRAIAGRNRGHARRVGEHQYAYQVSGGRPADRFLRQLLRAREAPWRRQAERGVERDHGDARGRARLVGRQERAGEGEREEQQRRDAQRQQDQLPQPAAVRMLDRRVLQHPHGGELDARLRLAPQQVQHDRHGGRQGAGEKERREERHQKSRDLVDRYASSASSSGWDVSSRW